MHRIVSFTFAIVAIATTASSAAAGLATVGYEYRPPAHLVRDASASSCRAGGGVTARLDVICPAAGPPCDDARVSVTWHDAKDEVVTGPVDLGAMDSREAATIFCSRRGTAAVLMPGRFRIVSIDGSASTAQPICAGSECLGYSHTAAATADGFFLAWTGTDYSSVFGRFVREDGSADGAVLGVAAPETETTNGTASSYLGPQLAAAGASGDRVIIAWVHHRYGTYHYEVRAVLVDRSGTDGDAIRLSQSTLGEVRNLELHRDNASSSIATWENSNQGGSVARRVAASDSLPTTTTTTTTLDPRVPEFFPARRLGDLEPSHYAPVPLSLAASALGRWFAGWAGGGATSVDDARRWAPDDAWGAMASDETGRWIRVFSTQDGEALVLVASTSDDDGATWSEAFDLYRSDLGATWHGENFLRIVAGPDGHWMAAWMERAQLRHTSEDGDWREDLLCGVRVAASSDRGATWQSAHTVAATDCYGEVDSLGLATDGAGSWVVAWGGERIGVARSLDDGALWSEATYPDLASAERHPSGVDVGFDGNGSWLLIAQATTKVVGDYTTGRVFVLRSEDSAATWTVPAGIVPWHDADRGSDFSPTLACEPGRCGIAWSSYEGADGAGLDLDVFSTFTTDGGRSWSSPHLVDRNARDDDFTDYTPRILVTPAGTWAVLWQAVLYGSPGAEFRFARSRGACGDGAAVQTEECDDGNTVEGDGCDSNCLTTGCGNTIVSPGEECDDGNDDETDDCISDCRTARCGDGFAQSAVEPCDDGNDIATDQCQADCTLSYCGDGLLWEGGEECDLGAELSDVGECLSTCRLARCGDGLTYEGVEECDDDNLENGDRCTKRCRIDPFCALSRDGGHLTATHALAVLKKAVGKRVRCPLRRCDMNSDGQVTSTDALRTLRAAVGALAVDGCEDRTLILRLATDEVLGALQLELDYFAAEGDIVKPDGGPECRIVMPHSLSASHLDAGRGKMVAALVSLEGFQGPGEVLRCTWRSLPGTGTEKMTLAIPDATDVRGDPLTPVVEMVLE